MPNTRRRFLLNVLTRSVEQGKAGGGVRGFAYPVEMFAPEKHDPQKLDDEELLLLELI